MVAGRVEAQGARASVTPGPLWLSGVPLDTLGRTAAELARIPGAAGAVCAPRGALRAAAYEDAVRALADAFSPRPVAAACGSGLGRENVLSDSGPVHAPSRLDALLEAWLKAQESGTRTRAVFRLEPDALDRVFDSILRQRMDSAPTDFIRSAYRVLVGRVGWAVAAVCRRRLATAVNSARFEGLRRLGAAEPVLLVCTTAARLAEFSGPGVAAAVPYAAAEAGLPPRPGGRALDDGYDEAKRLLDKLANYQLDLDTVAAEMGERP